MPSGGSGFFFQVQLKPLDQQGAGQADHEIDGQDRDPDLEGEKGGGHEFHALEGQFLDGDHRDDGRILDGGDELAGQGRHDPAQGLGEDNIPQLLGPGESQAGGGLPLALLDGLDACADDLGDVGAFVNSQGYGTGDENRHLGGFGHEQTQDAG